MKRFTEYAGTLIGSLLLVAVLVKCGHSAYEDHQLKQRHQTEAKNEEERLILSLHELALRTQANVGWAKQLAGGKRYRRSPILTAELQDVWLHKAPILFVGILKDVAKNADGTYRVQLQYGDGYDGHRFMYTQIRLEVQCSAELTAPLLILGRNPSRRGYFPDAAVVAAVSDVRVEDIKVPEEAEEARATAFGNCIATQAFSTRLPREWSNMKRTK